MNKSLIKTAVARYAAFMKAENEIEIARIRLNNAVAVLTDEETNEYVRQTDEVSKKI